MQTDVDYLTRLLTDELSGQNMDGNIDKQIRGVLDVYKTSDKDSESIADPEDIRKYRITYAKPLAGSSVFGCKEAIGTVH
jgi:hypothetical protein